MANKKETIGLAGEYAVASELCKRGFYAQLTLGNHKKTDLVVEDEDDEKLFRVSVKSKQGYRWPSVKGISQERDLLVFVDFKDKKLNDRPDYYVLAVEDWKKVVKKVKRRIGKGGKIDKTNTLYFDPREKYPKGWKGCAIPVKDVQQYKDCWPKVSTNLA